MSHTTGRWPELSFRAGTALFGRFGIEWDLARATDVELRDLAAWIGLDEEHRALLHGGDVVRVGQADDTLDVHGAVDGARREALSFLATVGRSEVSPRGRVTLPGLDPATRYRVTPVLVGDPEAGVEPAAWWGPVATAAAAATPAPTSHRDRPVDHGDPAVQQDEGGAEHDGTGATPAGAPASATVRRFAGTVLPGSALASAGLQMPLTYPERVVLLHVTAAD